MACANCKVCSCGKWREAENSDVGISCGSLCLPKCRYKQFAEADWEYGCYFLAKRNSSRYRVVDANGFHLTVNFCEVYDAEDGD